jgi:hypothetical protein
MPVEITWKVPQRVVYVNYSGHMTVQDIRDSIEQARLYIEEGTPPIHIILDIGGVTHTPHLIDLRHGVNYQSSPRQGCTLFVGAQGIARFISSVLSQLAGNRFYLFDTVDQAVAYLMRADQTFQQERETQ